MNHVNKLMDKKVFCSWNSLHKNYTIVKNYIKIIISQSCVSDVPDQELSIEPKYYSYLKYNNFLKLLLNDFVYLVQKYIIISDLSFLHWNLNIYLGTYRKYWQWSVLYESRENNKSWINNSILLCSIDLFLHQLNHFRCDKCASYPPNR